MEFFRSIAQWFIENKDAIVVTLTSTQFISFVGTIALLIKQGKSTKENTSSTDTLNANITTVSTLSSTIAKINEDVENIKAIQDEQNKALTEAIELQNLMLTKMNLLFEAQLQVWSTIKDDNIRTNVNTILTSAKYAEGSAIAELKEKLETLQKEMLEKTNNLTKDVETSISNVKKTVNAKTTVTRV